MSQLPLHNRFDVFVFAHREGNWLGSCLYSIERAIDFAALKGVYCTKSIIVRAPDAITLEWVNQKTDEKWTTVVLDEASLADARNAACDLSGGPGLVAFIDGSDMIGEAWLYQAAMVLEQSAGICRPQALMTFGQDWFSPDGFECILQPDRAPAQPEILPGNPYPSGFVASNDVVKSVSWPQVNERAGWGQEDWWWNCLTIERGIIQHIVPGSAHYRRMSVRPAPAGDRLRPGPVWGVNKPARGF